MDLKEQHDKLLADKPSGVAHDAESCIFCKPDDLEGGDMSNTYTEDELKAAIEAAVNKALAPFQEEAALETLAKVISDEKAPLEAEINELQKHLDTATVRAEKAEQDLDDLNQRIADEKAAEESARLLAERTSARKEQVKEFGFKDEYVEARLPRWTAMADEEFSELLDDWKAATAKKVETTTTTTDASVTTVPATTAMTSSREDDGGDAAGALRREVSRMGLRGNDIRTL